MCKKTLLSLIIPTYNCAEYIEETLDSVLSQLPADCELILVDDGSTDHTAEILRSYESGRVRIKLVLCKHCGVSAARNTGIDMAEGEWVAFMDCDDCLKAGFFERCMPLPEDNADLYIFSFERVEFLPETQFVTPMMLDDRVYDTAHDFADDYIRKRHLLVYSACNKFYRKSILDDYGIRFIEGMSFGEDRMFNYEYLMHAGCIITSRIVMFRYMQRNPDSASRRSFPDYFETIMNLHRAKMNCILKLSQGTDSEEKKAFIRADIYNEIERMIDRFEEHPEEAKDNLPKINELIFGRTDDISGRFDVVIVLGSTNCGYRLDRAYEAAAGDPDTIFLVTGGNRHIEGIYSEAEFMADRLKKYGIPENRILKETEAGNTYRNLELSAELIEKNMDTDDLCIGIVTGAFHIPRTRQMTAAIPWYANKQIVFIPAYGPNTGPDNWFMNQTGRDICLGEIAKCFGNDPAPDSGE